MMNILLIYPELQGIFEKGKTMSTNLMDDIWGYLGRLIDQLGLFLKKFRPGRGFNILVPLVVLGYICYNLFFPAFYKW